MSANQRIDPLADESRIASRVVAVKSMGNRSWIRFQGWANGNDRVEIPTALLQTWKRFLHPNAEITVWFCEAETRFGRRIYPRGIAVGDKVLVYESAESFRARIAEGHMKPTGWLERQVTQSNEPSLQSLIEAVRDPHLRAIVEARRDADPVVYPVKSMSRDASFLRCVEAAARALGEMTPIDRFAHNVGFPTNFARSLGEAAGLGYLPDAALVQVAVAAQAYARGELDQLLPPPITRPASPVRRVNIDPFTR